MSEFHPAELLKKESLTLDGVLRTDEEIATSILSDSAFSKESAVSLLCGHFHTASVASLGLADYSLGTLSAGAVLRYLYDTQKSQCRAHHRAQGLSRQYLSLDRCASRRNLELTETMRDKSKHGSLLWVVDRTKTAMGARFLGILSKSRFSVLRPLRPDRTPSRHFWSATSTEKS